MKLSIAAAILANSMKLSKSQDLVCRGPDTVAIAGSSTVRPVAEEWVAGYPAMTTFTIEGGGSSAGAARVSGDTTAGTAVEIGNMSREWRAAEGISTNGWLYSSVNGNTSRSAGQFPVALDSVSVIYTTMGGASSNKAGKTAKGSKMKVKKGTLKKETKRGGKGRKLDMFELWKWEDEKDVSARTSQSCVEALGGLTIDQLRWIFTSYSLAELDANGWDSSSVPNPDFISETRFWSELCRDGDTSCSAACEATQILIAGPPPGSGTYDFFSDVVFQGEGETFRFEGGGVLDPYFTSESLEVILAFLEGNPGSLGYFGFSVLSANEDVFDGASILNAHGVYVAPSQDTIADGSYNPFARAIYMNLNTLGEDLCRTIPFVEYGYTDDAAVLTVGFVPLNEGGKKQMEYQRFNTLKSDFVFSDKERTAFWCSLGTDVTIAGSSTVFPVAESWAAAYTALCPGSSFTVESGGSSTGAARVCNTGTRGTMVTIGNMSREWRDTEAVSIGGRDGRLYQCVAGDQTITVSQLTVGYDGVSFVVNQLSGTCVQMLAEQGLSFDQLRWMYSSYTEAQLQATGWDPMSITSDRDDGTHFWSELNPDCPATEILISGPDPASGTYGFIIEEEILTDFATGETVRGDYVKCLDENDCVTYVADNPFAIAYIGFALFSRNSDILTAVAVEDPSTGVAVQPQVGTIATFEYPFTRPLYMNVNNVFMDEIYNFLKYGYSQTGQDIVEFDNGYVPMYSFPPDYQESLCQIEDNLVM